MAKTNSLETAINELRKNYRKVLREAVQYATEEAEKDVHQHALSCLEEYYSNRIPNSYDRSDSLRHAFLPYKSVKSNGHYLISTVGIEYNSDALLSQFLYILSSTSSIFSSTSILGNFAFSTNL